jgi:predicted Zn-ribbon and HTH transcriptional regulator
MWLKDSQMQILQLLLKNKEGLTLTQIHEELSNKVAKSDILNDLNDLLTGN